MVNVYTKKRKFRDFLFRYKYGRGGNHKSVFIFYVGKGENLFRIVIGSDDIIYLLSDVRIGKGKPVADRRKNVVKRDKRFDFGRFELCIERL